MPDYNRSSSMEVVDVATVVDRHLHVSWSGVFAGLFAVLALLALFGQVGMAIGMSSFAPGDRAAPYLVGAGVYGAVTAIVAFLAGGWVATAFSRHAGTRTGAAQGALVWAVSVPVLAVLAA